LNMREGGAAPHTSVRGACGRVPYRRRIPHHRRSLQYRTAEEIRRWRETSNPIRRFRRFLERRGWWDEDKEAALQGAERKAVLAAMAAAERKPKPDLKHLFSDVLAGPALPPHLAEQERELQAHMAKYPDEYAAAH
jgi:2-oxoisovalerate dehydrogenase E1 component alpha subunit